MPIWFKKGSNPKLICYCNKVTEDQIIKAVVESGARTIKDIINITGAMKNSNCKINNPIGQCCSLEIQKVINNTIKTFDLKG
jgi:bacterioferritin-associated ferredoxin